MRHLFTYCWLLLSGLPRLAQAQNRPDLLPVAPFSIPATVRAGGVYPLSSVIKNQGAMAAQFNCTGYYLSADDHWDATDAYLGSNCQGGLLFPGQSAACSITATIPPLAAAGQQYVLCVADPLDAEQEANETNNVAASAVLVEAGTPALPDLRLWRPSLSFRAVPPGGSTGVFTFVFNDGPGAVAAYEIGFYLSADTIFSASTDAFLGLVQGSSLVPSGTGGAGTIHSAPVLPIPPTTPPGKYYLLVVADPRNVIAEANEANNSRALSLQVTGALAAASPAAIAGLAVYPNPVAHGAALHLALAGTPQLAVACYDGTGRLVSQQLVGGPGRAPGFDTAPLAPGLYQLLITGEQVRTTCRVQVE